MNFLSYLILSLTIGSYNMGIVDSEINRIVNSFDKYTLWNAGFNGIFENNMWEVQEVAEQNVNGKNIIVKTKNKLENDGSNFICMKLFEKFGFYTVEKISPCKSWIEMI